MSTGAERSRHDVVEPIAFRPLTSDDRDGMRALFSRLSPESRYRRYLSPKPRLTSRELEYLINVDRVQHVALAAVDTRDGSIIGVGRYVRDGERPTVATVAVEVADDRQNIGIGTALASLLVQHARASGVSLLTATTLWENVQARALLRRFGFRARASHSGVVELDAELGSARSAMP